MSSTILWTPRWRNSQVGCWALGRGLRLDDPSGWFRCIRLRASSLRVHFILESLQRDTRRGRRDQTEIRSQVPGVRLHGIGEARLVPVFFGRSKSILMHSADGDADRVYDVVGLSCMFRFSRSCLCLLRDTRRHKKLLSNQRGCCTKERGPKDPSA